MTRSAQKNTPNTALWRARHQCGLEIKQSARLLGHRTPDAIARYERGETEPSFDNAIRLSIIYGCDLEQLFPHKYQMFRDELTSRTLPIRKQAVKQSPTDLFERVNSCTYENALFDPERSADYTPFARDHVTRLAKRLAGLL